MNAWGLTILKGMLQGTPKHGRLSAGRDGQPSASTLRRLVLADGNLVPDQRFLQGLQGAPVVVFPIEGTGVGAYCRGRADGKPSGMAVECC